MKNIIIIGGGLSGLSAGVELSALGYRVQIFERRRICGGRVCSYIDKNGNMFDNGQHLMMGCYNASRRYIRLIGTEHLFDLQPSLRINYFDPSDGHLTFACPKLPAPLHLAGGLMNFKPLTVKDRLKMLWFVSGLAQITRSREMELDMMTADSWLERSGQSGTIRKYFWDIITVGALNNYPDKVSALMLCRVLRASLLGRKENSSLLIPATGLNECLIDPAVKFIKMHDGSVFTGVGISKLNADGSVIRSAETTDGRILSADNYISAVPWYAAEKIIPLRGAGYNDFISSPIVSVHLWFDRKVAEMDFAALTGMFVQWIFSRPVPQADRTGEQHLSLVISGAQECIALPHSKIIGKALEDLKKALPRMTEARILKTLVIKERQATFLPSPGLERKRPGAGTEFTNLFLAGDWTATGYPATIEGAVASGKKTADLIHSR